MAALTGCLPAIPELNDTVTHGFIFTGLFGLYNALSTIKLNAKSFSYNHGFLHIVLLILPLGCYMLYVTFLSTTLHLACVRL